MKTADERIAIETAFDAYRNQLDEIPDELFDVTPPGGGWSYAEVYAHILKATLGSSIALEKCTQSACPVTTKKPTLFGRLLLLLGIFPPVKTNVPQSVADKLAVDKITKEDARNLLIKCRRRIDTVTPLLHNATNNQRVAHPRLGMLNAKQWLKFIRIHLKHHLKQIERIKNKFAL
jgi:F0F1-type ATP synthase membrane subunit c/vacuolar-type H+-ATPase subunit K